MAAVIFYDVPERVVNLACFLFIYGSSFTALSLMLQKQNTRVPNYTKIMSCTVLVKYDLQVQFLFLRYWQPFQTQTVRS